MNKAKLPGRSVLAQRAQFRTSAGAMGGSKRQRAKRARSESRRAERAALRENFGER